MAMKVKVSRGWMEWYFILSVCREGRLRAGVSFSDVRECAKECVLGANGRSDFSVCGSVTNRKWIDALKSLCCLGEVITSREHCRERPWMCDVPFVVSICEATLVIGGCICILDPLLHMELAKKVF